MYQKIMVCDASPSDRGLTQETVEKFSIRYENMKLRFPIWDQQGKIHSWKIHHGPQTSGAKAQLYPWTALIAKRIVICEGEPDVWRLTQEGIACITCTSGAKTRTETWKNRWGSDFQGKEILLAYDNDPDGKEGMKRVAKALLPFAARVKTIIWPDGFQKDITDWLNAGHTFTELGTREITETDLGAKEEILSPNQTDVGNGIRFAHQHGDFVKFVPEWGWLCWDGKVWKPDQEQAELLAKHTARSLLMEAAEEEDSKTRKLLAKWALASENATKIRSMLAMAQSEPKILARTEQFDVDSVLFFNVQNGTLDLKAGRLRPHASVDRLTKIAGTIYDPDAECPLWDRFLDRIMGGNGNLLLFLQRAVGYSLSGDTGEQCLFFLWGLGANGKTTFLETIWTLFGDYGVQANMSTFLAQKFEGVNNDIARLRGARFVSAMEAGENRSFAENIIKHLTGGDQVTARFLYREYFSYTPELKLWLGANHRPAIRGTDWAIWRRIRLIPFRVTIPEEEQDHHLGAKLREELPGILNWALDGCQAWLEQGLKSPEEVISATMEYRAEMDVLSQFMEECTLLSPDERTSFSDLYGRYKEWCIEATLKPMSKQLMGRKLLDQLGLERDGTGGKISYLGITLKIG